MSQLTKLYEGINISGASVGVIYLPILANGSLTGLDVVLDSNASGSPVVFVLNKNGSPMATGTISVSIGTRIASITGLNLAVVKGDEITLDQSSGTSDAPITLNLIVDDGVTQPQIKPISVALITGTLANLAVETGTIQIAKSSILNRLQSDKYARIRFYGSAAARTADLSRAFGDWSVLGTKNVPHLDLQLSVSTGLDWYVNSPHICTNNDSPTTATIYYAVQNLSGSSGVVTLNVTATPLEN